MAVNKNKNKNEENQKINGKDNQKTNDNNNNNDNTNNKDSNGIFSISDELNSEVIQIIEAIGNKDKGTLEFYEYLKSKGSNLKED